jgi:hypothetical protein
MQLFVTSNAAQVARTIAAFGPTAHAAVQRTVDVEGEVFRMKVRARASGPRAQTGDYRRSINMQTRASSQQIEVEVGTNSVQGRRLEFGFWGMTDSLGRLFHQHAYPHFQPAADEMEQRFPIAIERTVDQVFGR